MITSRGNKPVKVKKKKSKSHFIFQLQPKNKDFKKRQKVNLRKYEKEVIKDKRRNKLIVKE